MKAFAGRKHLAKKVELHFDDDDERPRLFCDEPAVVARFAGHMKQAAARRWSQQRNGPPGQQWPPGLVLMRGQNENHTGMVPALFRPLAPDVPPAPPELLLKAESKFESQLRARFSQKRFARANVGALLQHYGLRTSWLDLVDNLWVAAWFASVEIGPANSSWREVRQRTKGSGWIYFIAPDAGPRGATCADLRLAHHGLSLRPHTQHGWSVRGPSALNDLDSYVVATVEFPIDDRWVLGGHLGSPQFMFPPAQLDDTLKRLIDTADKIARRIEDEVGIAPLSLGSVYSIAG